MARNWHWCPCWVAVCALLTLSDALCQKPALPDNALVVPLLVGVNLTCADCEGGVSWSRRNQTIRSQDSGHLFLRSVNYTDEDTYTCHKGGAAICSVQLLVKDDPEEPQISCFIRYPTHNITCEWTPTGELRPHAKVTLIAWGLKEKHHVSGCSYIRSSRKFMCSSPYREGDSGGHTLSLCVTGRTDHRISNTVRKSLKELLKPDPPVSVRVAPLERQRRHLRVSWSPPKLWLGAFYELDYQVQYRVADSRHVSNGTTPLTHFVIKDGLARRRHVVRVRAREEFSDTWSEWSEEVAGTPWSEEEAESLVTPDPIEEYDAMIPSKKGEELDYGDGRDPSAPSTAAPQYAWLIAGVAFSITLLLVLVLGILVRYSEVKLLKLKRGLLRSLFQPQQKLPATQPPSAALLMSPMGVTVTDPRGTGKD